MIERGLAHSIQRCDTRDTTADGHTKGNIDREMLLQAMGEFRRSSMTWRDMLHIGPARHEILTPPD
eukprot:8677133-Pyramimonas_sp.AAC.1